MHVAERSFFLCLIWLKLISSYITLPIWCSFMLKILYYCRLAHDICTAHNDHEIGGRKINSILFYYKYHKIFTYLPLDYAAGGVESWSCWMWDDAVVSIEEGLQKIIRKVVIVFWARSFLIMTIMWTIPYFLRENLI